MTHDRKMKSRMLRELGTGFSAHDSVVQKRSLADAAQEIAASGWPIFPCNALKRPLCGEQGFHQATCDVETVRAWWVQWPDAAIGFVPGRVGMLVLDIDVKDGARGLETAQEHGLLKIETLRARTPSGGWHVFLQRPRSTATIGNSKVAFGAESGIDVRCDSGYVLIAPSTLPNGAYEWHGEESCPAEMPAYLADMLTPEPVVARASFPFARPVVAEDLDRRILAYMDHLPTGLSEGQGRNNAIYGCCAFLTHDLALSVEDAEPWAHEYNRRFADPLSTRELEQTLLSAAKHGARLRGVGLTSLRRRAHTFGSTFGNRR